MILHNCPHCNAGNLYAPDMQGTVNCHSCGAPFELSRFTRSEKDALTRLIQTVRANADQARHSRIIVYLVACLGFCFIVWAAISALGVVPDEWRMFNRRFVSLRDDDRVAGAVGLVATGVVAGTGSIDFLSFGSAFAVTNDGFLLTSRHVFPDTDSYDIWVYINKSRINARVVVSDALSAWALLKVDEELKYRFSVWDEDRPNRVNVPVLAVGFHEMQMQHPASPTKQEIARTTGTISRQFTDDVGTQWIEHTAVLTPGSNGGPLLVDDEVIGINLGGDRGIYLALAIAPLRDKLFKEIEKARERPQRSGEMEEAREGPDTAVLVNPDPKLAFTTANQARIGIAKAAVGRNGPIAKALTSYKWDLGRLPETDEGLAVLYLEKGRHEDERFKGPYMEGYFEDLKDPWGNPFEYRCPGDVNEDGYDLWSIGPDLKDDSGKEGSDDITNWIKR